MIYTLQNRKPNIQAQHYFIAENATVIGSVIIKNNVSIWFNAVVRADNDVITIDENTNLQDGVIVHTDENIPMHIGRNVTVGHKAMLHGCNIGNNGLIGINAVILNHVEIGENCIIGANTLLLENTKIPAGSLVVGSPGRIVRTLTVEEIAKITWSAHHYVENFKRYQQELTEEKHA
jgi:carbonic anhydrase/acetyltransferase-like protein (isoleucine patch superfamily)